MTDTPANLDKLNTTAMLQGVLTFVTAITIVEFIKEIPVYLRDHVESIFLTRVLVTIIVILAVALIAYVVHDLSEEKAEVKMACERFETKSKILTN